MGGEGQQPVRDLLRRLLPLWRQVTRRHKGPPAGRVLGVCKAQLGALHSRPGIHPALIGRRVVRLEPLPASQLQVGDDEIQLQPALVLVLNPQAAVLPGLKAGQEGPLEAVHEGPLLIGRKIGLRERQHAAGVLLGVPAGVDQCGHLVRVAAQQGSALPLAVPA